MIVTYTFNHKTYQSYTSLNTTLRILNHIQRHRALQAGLVEYRPYTEDYESGRIYLDLETIPTN